MKENESGVPSSVIALTTITIAEFAEKMMDVGGLDISKKPIKKEIAINSMVTLRIALQYNIINEEQAEKLRALAQEVWSAREAMREVKMENAAEKIPKNK